MTQELASRTVIPADGGSIHAVQITDLHMMEGDGFFDVEPGATLGCVVDAITGLAEVPDLVLATGDLVNTPDPVMYARLREQLERLPAPVFCLPGNHDEPELMHRELNRGRLSTEKLLRCGPWSMILLDSYLAGEHGGRLAAAELDFLSRALDQEHGRHVLICLHHHPVFIGSPWMDAMMLQNGVDLLAAVDRCKDVRGILWGHVHQEYNGRRGRVALHGTPSTCVQFRPRTQEPERDDRPPAYRELRLYGNGGIETAVHWIGAE